MKPWCPEGLRVAAVLALAWPVLALAQPVPPLEAHYEVLRNGKPLGEAETRHLETARGWQMQNASRGTQGSARLLGFNETTSSEGTWIRQSPRPARFQQAVKVATMNRDWAAEFDWSNTANAAGVVTLHDGDDVSTWDISPDTSDPLSVGLRLRAGLSAGEDHWVVHLVDRDEIDNAEFRAFAEERIDTALGCLVTRRVEKVRAPDSKRYTRTWYARDHGWAPVKVEHGKTGGNHLETRILSLEVDGVPVNRGPACDPSAD